MTVLWVSISTVKNAQDGAIWKLKNFLARCLRSTSLFLQRVIFNISILDHMKKLKNISLVGNTGHFVNEFGVPDSKGLEVMKVDNIGPQKIFRRPRRSQ